MDNPNMADPPTRDDSPLTTITTLVSRSGQERFVAEAFEQTFGEDREGTSHRAALLIQQEGGISFLLSRFSGRDALERWRASGRHQRMVDAFDAHSLRELCTIEQPVVRICVPSAASGPKWKTLVASWVVTFPLLLGLVRLLDRVLPWAPQLVRIALTSVVMSVAITWLTSPAILRLTRTWRLSNQQMKIVVVASAAGGTGSTTAHPIA